MANLARPLLISDEYVSSFGVGKKCNNQSNIPQAFQRLEEEIIAQSNSHFLDCFRLLYLSNSGSKWRDSIVRMTLTASLARKTLHIL